MEIINELKFEKQMCRAHVWKQDLNLGEGIDIKIMLSLHPNKMSMLGRFQRH